MKIEEAQTNVAHFRARVGKPKCEGTGSQFIFQQSSTERRPTALTKQGPSFQVQTYFYKSWYLHSALV
jgi:hypothetical protein